MKKEEQFEKDLPMCCHFMSDGSLWLILMELCENLKTVKKNNDRLGIPELDIIKATVQAKAIAFKALKVSKHAKLYAPPQVDNILSILDDDEIRLAGNLGFNHAMEKFIETHDNTLKN